MYALFSKLRNAMTDGFKNLAKKNSETNANLSELSGGLQQLKNSLATAFSPILNAITPALSTLINYLVQACNVVGQFFAALTGQKTYTTASKVQKDYAASLDKTGNSAANAADKVKKSLMGFDEINKLDDDSKSSSGGSSSDGGSFEENEVTNKYANFAQMIKDAWANADFTEIGKIAGQKLNAALENIPWDDIKNTCNKIAKSVATFLNGFMEGTDWKLVGKTIAEGINTGVETASTFVTTFDWSKLGKSIGQTIDSTIKNIDWSLLGKTFSDAVKGWLTALCEAVENVDWRNLGESVKKMIQSVDWKGILQKAAELAGAAAGGAAAFVTGLLGDIPGEIYNYFMDKKEECGGSLVRGIYEGIKDALKNVGDWIKENILDPFVEGFKKAFGIHSPSTVFKELGGYCIDGLFEGLKNIPGDIAEIAKKIWNGIKDAWDKLGDKALEVGAKILNTGKELWDGVKAGWDSVKGKVLEVGATIKDGATGLWNGVKDAWGNAKARALPVAVNLTTKAKTLANTVKSGWKKLKEGSKKVGFLAYISNSASKLASSFQNAWGGGRKVPLLVQISNLEQIKNDVQKIINPLGNYKIQPKATGGVYSNGQWHNITAYASGGTPGTGQIFLAREAGPELVGTIGGHTAVMNNNQIVSSVAAGVYSAVISAMKATGGSKTTPVFNIYVGGKKVTDVVIEEVNSRTKATGRCPILT